MPRLTHIPEEHQQHSRAQVREQQRRHMKKHWRLDKDLYSRQSGALVVVGDEATAAMLGQDGPVVSFDPEVVRRGGSSLRETAARMVGMRVEFNRLQGLANNNQFLRRAVRSQTNEGRRGSPTEMRRGWKRGVWAAT